jgi:hypothetical protein
MAEEPESPRRFLTKQMIVIAAALITAVGGLGAAYVTTHDGKDEKVSSATQVRECIDQHKLAKAQIRTKPKLTKDENGEPEYITYYKRCDWPPAPGADKTGYSEVSVTARLGPGESEATDMDTADVIKSSCSELEVTYSIAAQGDQEPLKPFRSIPNRVVFYTGEAWQRTPDETPLPFYYEQDELVVLRNSKVRLDSVRCVA